MNLLQEKKINVGTNYCKIRKESFKFTISNLYDFSDLHVLLYLK